MVILSRINGSRFMTLNPTADTVTYPSDGEGGKTATSTSSELYNAPADTVVIDGIWVSGYPAAARTVTLWGHDGSTQIGMDITIPIAAATLVPQFFPIGGPNGLRVPAQATGKCNFGVKVAGTSDIKGHVCYRRVRP